MKKAVKPIFGVLLIAIIIVCSTSCEKINRFIMGDPNCVIASDYSSICLYDNEYLPLDFKDLGYNYGDILIDEAQVEGIDFFTKLLFGDIVYAVKDCPDNELILLQTDYDDAPSNIYCLKEKLDDYQAIIDNFEVKNLQYETIDKDWQETDRPLDEAVVELLNSGNMEKNPTFLECTREGKSEFLSVKGFGNDKIFFEWYGRFLYQNGQYYWDDGSGVTYIIPDEYDAFMNEYFSYMFK